MENRASAGAGVFVFEAAEESEQAVEQRKRMRRAAGDEQIHGQQIADAVAGFGMVAIGAAGDRARAAGDDDLRRGHGKHWKG